MLQRLKRCRLRRKQGSPDSGIQQSQKRQIVISLIQHSTALHFLHSKKEDFLCSLLPEKLISNALFILQQGLRFSFHMQALVRFSSHMPAFLFQYYSRASTLCQFYFSMNTIRFQWKTMMQLMENCFELNCYRFLKMMMTI